MALRYEINQHFYLMLIKVNDIFGIKSKEEDLKHKIIFYCCWNMSGILRHTKKHIRLDLTKY